MIPKVIHYCWFGGGVMPAISQKCMESWRKHCGSFEIKLWNENNFDVNITKQQPTKVGGFEMRLKVNQRLKPSL